jgi:hypothetical protein
MADEVSTFREQDKLLRAGVRENLGAWLNKLNCKGDVEKKLEYKMALVRKLRDAPVAIEVDRANEQHYEVPTEFFKTVRATKECLLIDPHFVTFCYLLSVVA